MGMSTYVRGIRLPDEKWHQMKAAWDACKAAGVPVPVEVDDFFGGAAPDEKGLAVKVPVLEESDEGRYHYTVELAKLPPNITHLVFTNAW